ncbi:MAG TPA: SRPBCC family protein [Kribbella sp.]|uniref:SRPBCC family protein n=1 Tax=Kribbella sp. TaxID=1871183 RepID=UPI002D79EFBB|nr:SRPBCC family protein [Kribbella sp.]HET6295941.1 SRPBCC family protein [Kribbella sp.]
MNETLTVADGRTQLRMERALAHPAEKVWRALTEPSELSRWFPAAVELDLRLDGPISFTFPDGEDDFVEDPDNTGVIRAFDPPRLLEYTWGVEVLRWELEPTADGCLLTLTATFDDRPGSASFTSGWTICFDALDRVLGGSAVPEKDYAELHEYYVKAYGLDQGEVLDDGSIRFERQLIRPKELVWSVLTGAEAAAIGSTPPAGFVAKGIEPGPVEELTEPTRLAYSSPQGEVAWSLRDGNGGARLVVTQAGPAGEYLAAWHDLIESLAGALINQR